MQRSEITQCFLIVLLPRYFMHPKFGRFCTILFRKYYEKYRKTREVELGLDRSIVAYPATLNRF